MTTLRTCVAAAVALSAFASIAEAGVTQFYRRLVASAGSSADAPLWASFMQADARTMTSRSPGQTVVTGHGSMAYSPFPWAPGSAGGTTSTMQNAPVHPTGFSGIGDAQAAASWSCGGYGPNGNCSYRAYSSYSYASGDEILPPANSGVKSPQRRLQYVWLIAINFNPIRPVGTVAVGGTESGRGVIAAVDCDGFIARVVCNADGKFQLQTSENTRPGAWTNEGVPSTLINTILVRTKPPGGSWQVRAQVGATHYADTSDMSLFPLLAAPLASGAYGWVVSDYDRAFAGTRRIDNPNRFNLPEGAPQKRIGMAGQ